MSEQVETIQKVYVQDLREKQPLHTVFKVTRKSRQTGRSGKPYVVLSLGDRTGVVEARIFDDVERFEPIFVEGDYVLVKGEVITWQKRPQVVIQGLERLDPEPIDASEFEVPEIVEPVVAPQAPSAAPAVERAEGAGREAGGRAVSQIRELVLRVQDTHVKALLLAFLDDPEVVRGLPLAPAAKGIHHAYKGGLADHILSVMKLAHRIADHYPMADRDLLIAGALLHDIGKVQEIGFDKNGFEYTDEGRLVGHLVMTAQAIREKSSRIEGFPPLLEQHITHIVLAHHGQLEWGSPKVPMTLEALLVHLLDSIDSRVASWLELMERDQNANPRWTDVSRLYDRHLWKGPAPTGRGRSPVEGRPRRRPQKQKKGGQPEPKEKEQRERAPKFPPLSQLAPSTQSEGAEKEPLTGQEGVEGP
ncbi:MAG: HD domain-containing protein [Myxococcaceae bacterium]